MIEGSAVGGGPGTRAKGRQVVCILTHEPATAIAGLSLYAHCELVLIVTHVSSVADLKRRLDKTKSVPPVKIVPHAIELDSEGCPRYGMLKWFQHEALKKELRTGDFGWLVDHDPMLGTCAVMVPHLVRRQNALGKERKKFWENNGFTLNKKSPGYKSNCFGARYKALSPAAQREYARFHVKYSRKLSGSLFAKRGRLLEEEARKRGFCIFTFEYANGSHNAQAQRGAYYPTLSWSGIVGVLKETPNLFNPSITVCEDTEAAVRAATEKGGLAVLRDSCTVVQMTFKKNKYVDGGPQTIARIRNQEKILAEYNPKLRALGFELFFKRTSCAVPRLAVKTTGAS